MPPAKVLSVKLYSIAGNDDGDAAALTVPVPLIVAVPEGVMAVVAELLMVDEEVDGEVAVALTEVPCRRRRAASRRCSDETDAILSILALSKPWCLLFTAIFSEAPSTGVAATCTD